MVLSVSSITKVSDTTSYMISNWVCPFLEKYKEIRVSLIKEIFRKVTSEWGKYFVLYPLSSREELQIML